MRPPIDTLADDYWAHYLAVQPDRAHTCIGDYGRAGEFEEATREARGRRDRRAAGASRRGPRRSTATGLDEQQRITRAVLGLRRRPPGPTSPRPGWRSSPPTRSSASRSRCRSSMGDARAARRRRRRGAGRQVPRAGPLLRRAGRAAARGRGQRAVPRGVRGARHRRAARRAAVHAGRRRPAAARPRRRPPGIDVDGWKARLRDGDRVRRTTPAWRRTATCCATRCCRSARPDERCGLSWLPDGEEAYAATLRYFTTTDKTAQEIHDIGLAQIAKLADEYRALGPEVVGTDDLEQIFEAMRTDPKLHFERGEELVEASEIAMQRAWDGDARLVRGAAAGAVRRADAR